MAERIIDKEIKDIIIRYIEIISKHYKIEAVILFGSYAKGTNTEDSDIDIAIITNDLKNDIIDEEINLMRLRRNIDVRIEPHILKIEDYKKKATPFIKEIIENGIKVA